MDPIAKAIIVVGLAAVSAYTHVKTDGWYGEGWGVLAVVALILL